MKKILLLFIGLVAICLAYLTYSFRYASDLQTIQSSDGKIALGYDRIQKRWLINEYKQYELSLDGPYIFHDAKEIVSIVRGKGNSYDLLRRTHKSLPDSLFCPVSYRYTGGFYVRLQDTLQEPSSFYNMPDKMLALSDIEGNFQGLADVLLANGVVDTQLNWAYGKGHLVLVGDFVDRGAEVTQCLWLIYKLEQEAKNSGGAVHYILGNHEQMLLQGNATYAAGKYKELIRRMNMPYKDLYAANTELGRWLRTKNVIERIGNLLLVHGGISPEVASQKITLDSINCGVRRNIDKKVSELNEPNTRLLLDTKGILWYRGLVSDHKEDKKLRMPEFSAILNMMHAEKIIIGHTIVDHISTDYDGKLIRLDVKHSEQVPEALLIEDERFFRVNAEAIKSTLQ
jgi:hypothetical protein